MKIKFSIGSNNTLVKVLIVLSFFIFLTGCMSVKPAGVKSGKNLFETFYVGEEGTQYFIKPLVLFNPQNREELFIDFTFRYKNEVKDSVVINLSLLSSDIFRSIDSVSLSNITHTIKSNNSKLLFNEKKNKLFNSRFSTKISLIELINMFENDNWKITIYSNSTYSTYTSTKRTKKAIKNLQNKLFVLFQ